VDIGEEDAPIELPIPAYPDEEPVIEPAPDAEPVREPEPVLA
jgi:hypothetical protein